jgi:hypothetical protein
LFEVVVVVLRGSFFERQYVCLIFLAVERSVLQFGKTSNTRFVLDFKYPLSPLQAFGIAISTFASDDVIDQGHEQNNMVSPTITSSYRKHIDSASSLRMLGRSGSFGVGSIPRSPLLSPFPSK